MSATASSLGRRKRGPGSLSQGSTPNTTTTKSTRVYDRAFQQHLIDFDIFPHGYKYPDGRVPPKPENIDEIRAALAQSRRSLSPSCFSNGDFETFQQADADASKERQVIISVIPAIEGDIGDRKCVAGEVPFTNLDPLTDGSLAPGNPDRYYGAARPEQIDRKVRADLDGFIVPSTQHDLPVAPNFFMAVKGPDGSFAVAQRQALYDAVLGARGQHELESYGKSKVVYDNKAYTLTCIYHSGQLKMYTIHLIPPTTAGGRPGYVMTQIRTDALTGDEESFRKGTAAYRNGKDWAKLQRDKAINQANETVARLNSHAPPDANPALSFATDVSIDTIESQDTLRPPNHGSNAPSPFYDSDTSADGPLVEPRPPAKRATGPPEGLQTGNNSAVESNRNPSNLGDEITSRSPALGPASADGKDDVPTPRDEGEG